jgi:hypothetical protein
MESFSPIFAFVAAEADVLVRPEFKPTMWRKSFDDGAFISAEVFVSGRVRSPASAHADAGVA